MLLGRCNYVFRRRAMAIRNKRVALVCAGLAVCNMAVTVAAQAQDVSFEAARNFAAGDRPQSVAVGDFNGDLVQRLALANLTAPHTLSLLFTQPDGVLP